MSRYCTITINGKRVRTRVDKDGVQRLPNCRALSALFACGALDLNVLGRAVKQDGTCTMEVRRWLYQRIGYSVCGYSEIFPDDEISNPLWKKSRRKKS